MRRTNIHITYMYIVLLRRDVYENLCKISLVCVVTYLGVLLVWLILFGRASYKGLRVSSWWVHEFVWHSLDTIGSIFNCLCFVSIEPKEITLMGRRSEMHENMQSHNTEDFCAISHERTDIYPLFRPLSYRLLMPCCESYRNMFHMNHLLLICMLELGLLGYH